MQRSFVIWCGDQKEKEIGLISSFNEMEWNSNSQGVAEFDQKIRGVIVDNKGTTNHHRTWGHKPRLASENQDSSSRREG
ncbi:hypothetical protein TNCV_4829491 [Trichonephila clavipes]|nr:hypothetical protein TNCV_4829491 [Trichonephila clavipes]